MSPEATYTKPTTMESTSSTPQDQAAAIANLADHLQTGISSSSPNVPVVTDENLHALDKHLDQLPLSRSVLSVSTRRLIDVSGTRLWNSCVQALAVCEDALERGVLSKVAYFSFNMLESVASRRGPGNWRILEIALITAKCCLENEYLESSLKALEAAAARLDSLEKSETSIDRSKLSAITTEYYMLRIYLSWLQGRPDIAEHFFKISKPLEHLDARKMVVEICCAVGLSALSKGQLDISLIWLERALHPNLWSELAIEQADLALKNMRLLSLHASVRANLQLNTTNSWNYVYDGLHSLQIEYKDTLPVIILQLQVLSREEQPNYEEYSKCLQTLIQTMDVTEECLGMALYHVRKISSWSIEPSIETFEQLLLNKLLPSRNQALINHCFVTFIWTVTGTDKYTQHDLDNIANMLSRLKDHGCSPLSEEACHASLAVSNMNDMQTRAEANTWFGTQLIWRRIEHAVSTHNFLIAEKWCLLAIKQPLFGNCCAANKAIFQRKWLLCAIESRSSITHAALSGILERYRDTPPTIYLVYKIALMHGYNDLRSAALEALK